MDMFLPIIPLRSVTVSGFEESDLANDVRKAAKALGIEVLPADLSRSGTSSRGAIQQQLHQARSAGHLPEIELRQGFVRYRIMKKWRTERNHAPSDDLSQPVDFKAAADFNRFYLAVVESVANRPTRPRWNADSFFRRFAQPNQ